MQNCPSCNSQLIVSETSEVVNYTCSCESCIFCKTVLKNQDEIDLNANLRAFSVDLDSDSYYRCDIWSNRQSECDEQTQLRDTDSLNYTKQLKNNCLPDIIDNDESNNKNAGNDDWKSTDCNTKKHTDIQSSDIVCPNCASNLEVFEMSSSVNLMCPNCDYFETKQKSQNQISKPTTTDADLDECKPTRTATTESPNERNVAAVGVTQVNSNPDTTPLDVNACPPTPPSTIQHTLLISDPATSLCPSCGSNLELNETFTSIIVMCSKCSFIEVKENLKQEIHDGGSLSVRGILCSSSASSSIISSSISPQNSSLSCSSSRINAGDDAFKVVEDDRTVFSDRNSSASSSNTTNPANNEGIKKKRKKPRKNKLLSSVNLSKIDPKRRLFNYLYAYDPKFRLECHRLTLSKGTDSINHIKMDDMSKYLITNKLF